MPLLQAAYVGADSQTARLDPGDDNQIVAHRVLDGTESTRKPLDVGERVLIADKRIHFREALVFQRDTGRPALTQLARKKASVVEIAEAVSPSTSTGSSVESTMRSTASTSRVRLRWRRDSRANTKSMSQTLKGREIQPARQLQR